TGKSTRFRTNYQLRHPEPFQNLGTTDKIYWHTNQPSGELGLRDTAKNCPRRPACLIENLGLKPRRFTAALLLNMSIVYEIYAKM
ncbi:MAG: hypothetical protein ACKPGT_08375, partial [Microcystis sp.]